MSRLVLAMTAVITQDRVPVQTGDHSDAPRRRCWRRLLAAAPLMLASPCLGQSDTSRIPARLCWRGRPAAACRTFLITEFGVDLSSASTQTIVSENYGAGGLYRSRVRDFDSRFVWTIGPMFNTGPRTALGGTLSLSPLGRQYRAALEARRRWWVTPGLGLDLSAGGQQMAVVDPARRSYRNEYGLTAGAFVVGADLINVNGRVDVLLTGGKVRAGTSFGVSGGSYFAVVGSLTLGLLVFAFLAAGPYD